MAWNECAWMGTDANEGSIARNEHRKLTTSPEQTKDVATVVSYPSSLGKYMNQ